MGQHCLGNFLVQCWPRQIQKTLLIIFLSKVVCGMWKNIVQVVFFRMLAQVDQDRIV